MQVVQTSCSSLALPSLASSQGLCWSTYSLTSSASSHDLAQRAAELARLVEGGQRRCGGLRRRQLRGARPRRSRTSLPPKRLVMKPAARLAMLTYLPTRSLLTRATKSSGLKSRSSTLRVELGGDVVAQPLGVQAELEVAQRARCRCRATCDIFSPRDRDEAVHVDVGRAPCGRENCSIAGQNSVWK